MKSFISFLTESKKVNFISRYINLHKDHPLVKSNPEEAKSLIRHAQQFAQGHDEAGFLTKQLLDGTYKPEEDDLTIKTTLSNWRKAKTRGLVTGNLRDHSHDTISAVFRDIPELNMQKNKADALSELRKYHIGQIDHPEHGKLDVIHIQKNDVKDDKEYKNISAKLRKTCSGHSWCVLPEEHGKTHLKHYSHGHGIFFYTNKEGTPVLSHGFGDRGIVRPDNSVIDEQESNNIQKQTSKLLSGSKKEAYDFFTGNNKNLSLEQQRRMYDEFGEGHAAAHFADPKMDTHPEILSKLFDHNEERVRRAAIEHPNVTPKHITKALNDREHSIRIAAIQHPNVTSEHITQALNDPEPSMREIAIRHPNVTSEHITQALDYIDNHWYSYAVRQAAIKHPNATLEHITKALNDPNPKVRQVAIKHPNATPKNITKALSDFDPKVREAAIEHPNATPKNITKALHHSDPKVRVAAARHPNATSENITKALSNHNSDVLYSAISNPNATTEHITKALSIRNSDIRYLAISHPNATSEHIKQAIVDPDYRVRAGAAKNPKATSEHIRKALNDPHPNVRQAAIKHPNVTSEHITQALNDFKDPDSVTVRAAAARHPKATSEHIKQAIVDPDHRVQRAAMSNPRINDAIKSAVAENKPEPVQESLNKTILRIII